MKINELLILEQSVQPTGTIGTIQRGGTTPLPPVGKTGQTQTAPAPGAPTAPVQPVAIPGQPTAPVVPGKPPAPVAVPGQAPVVSGVPMGSQPVAPTISPTDAAQVTSISNQIKQLQDRLTALSAG